MSVSPITDARDIVFEVLSASTALAAIVSTRIYPGKAPQHTTKPFVRVGAADAEPERFAGFSTAAVAMIVHLFESEREDQPDPETGTGDAVQVIADALDADPRIFVQRTMCRQSADESDDWHGMVMIEVTPH